MSQEKIEFKDQWNELCPIYLKDEDVFEQVGTGVLINIFNNVYLVTASHVIDEMKNTKTAELLIPLSKSFYYIESILYHRYLQDGEKRSDDKVDISFYKLSQDMVNILDKYSIPLTEEKINFSDDYSVDNLGNINVLSKIVHPKEVPNKMKRLYEDENDFDSKKINDLNNIICDITITFAGFPNTKSKNRGSEHYGEIVYYHGRGLSKEEYVLHNYEKNINILAQYGKYGTMNKDFISTNFPKPQGISGGGVYKIMKTVNGFDRVLIGIVHTYKKKEHLFIGTNISFCIDMICRVLKKEALDE